MLTRKKRRIIFYSLILLFLIVGAALIFYAQGWRLDWKSFTAQKVGGIYVRSFPSGAEIKLNGKRIPLKNNFFQSGTLISNLTPGIYDLELSLPEYKEWRMSVEVMPALVSEQKYAVLVPEESTIYMNGPFEKLWVLGNSLLLQNKNQFSIDDLKFSGTALVGWSNDFRRILVENGARRILADRQTSTTTDLNAILRRSGLTASKIDLDPANTTRIFLLNKNSFMNFDTLLSTTTFSLVVTSTMDVFEASRSRLAWSSFDSTKKTSALFVYNRAENAYENNPSVLPGKTVKMEWSAENMLAVLQDDGELYIRRPGTQPLDKLASDAKDFFFAPEGDKIAVLEKDAIEVFDFENRFRPYFKFAPADVRDVQNLVWYEDREHLFLVYADAVKLLDLQDAKSENIIPVADTRSAGYDEAQNSLYFIASGEVRAVNFPD